MADWMALATGGINSSQSANIRAPFTLIVTRRQTVEFHRVVPSQTIRIVVRVKE